MSLKTNKRTLLQAVNCEDIEGVTELLSKPKTNVNYTDNHNFSGNWKSLYKYLLLIFQFPALHHAVVIRNVAIIKLLLGHKKIDTRILTHEGYSVLYLACSSESMSAEIVELILKRDATLVHLCNKQEQSPLQVAITRERLELVTMLVKFGASVNHKDVDGETSLHYAASCANYGIVEFLLDAGADPTINSNEELNPLCLLLVRTSIERDEQLVFSCFQLLFSRTYVKDVETDTYNIADIFRPTFLSSAFSSNSIASYLIHNTYNKNNSMYWMIQKLEEQSMNLLDPNEFRSYINIFLHDKIRRYDDFKFSR